MDNVSYRSAHGAAPSRCECWTKAPVGVMTAPPQEAFSRNPASFTDTPGRSEQASKIQTIVDRYLARLPRLPRVVRRCEFFGPLHLRERRLRASFRQNLAPGHTRPGEQIRWHRRQAKHRAATALRSRRRANSSRPNRRPSSGSASPPRRDPASHARCRFADWTQTCTGI